MSILDRRNALKMAVDNPDKQVVFFAIGFETTAPSTAVTLVRARDLGLPNQDRHGRAQLVDGQRQRSRELVISHADSGRSEVSGDRVKVSRSPAIQSSSVAAEAVRWKEFVLLR